MGKCKSCNEGKCKGNYKQRHECDDPKNCTCTCQESPDDTFGKAGLSILGGAAAITGGVALTVMTGGLAAVFGGAAIVGAGSSMVMNPIVKKASGERMTAGDYVTDVVVGGVIGAATGGIGAGGSALTKGASGAVKLGVRVGAGAVSGITGGAISEGGRAVKGEEVNLDTVGKSMAVGLICGGIGGGSSHLASNASKLATNEAAKVAVRIGTQTASGAAVDSAVQYAETGEVDLGQVAMRAAGQTVIAASSETARYAAERSESHANKVTKQRIKEDFKDPNEAKEVKKMVDKANKITKRELNELRENMIEREKSKVRIENLKKGLTELNEKHIKPLENKKADLKQSLRDGKTTFQQRRGSLERINDKLRALEKGRGVLNNELEKQTVPKPIRKKDNFHFLDSDHKGQAAMDLPPKDGDLKGFSRSGERIILEHDGRRTGQRFTYAGKVEDHDYSKAPKPNNLRPVYDPHEAIRPNNFVPTHGENEDLDEKDKYE